MTAAVRGGWRWRESLASAIALRVLGIIAILFIISMLVFSLLYLAPGDLVRTLIGNRTVTPEMVAAVRERYRLDDPLAVQYASWLLHALRGDFGESIRMQQPVAQVIGARLPLTLALAGLSFVVALVTSIPLGILAAVRRGRVADTAATGFALFGLSAPTFAVGLLLLYAFAYYLPIFPVYGAGQGFFGTIYHLVLPAVALAAGVGAILMRVTRAAMIRELDSDYVTFLRGRGVAERTTLAIAVRGASIAMVTSSGLVLTFLVSGTILVETIFALPGLGGLLEASVTYKDLPVVQGVTLLIAAFISVIALLADLSYRVLDPRMHTRRRAS